MPSFLKSRRARIVAVIAAVSLLVQWWLAAYPRGMLMAYLDHARGHYEVQVWGSGPHSDWYEYRRRLLKERYGVSVRSHRVSDWAITPWVVWYADGYNTVSDRLLTEKYGRNIYRECAEEAERLWKAEHPDQWADQ